MRLPPKEIRNCCASDARFAFAVVAFSLVIAVTLLLAAAGLAEALAPSVKASVPGVIRMV
ncbi:MAG: hypothetical protein KDE14_15540 [Rhodobacteraceae bacterium]|nr:hypothetical protein [Paracoccaceae bacterium]